MSGAQRLVVAEQVLEHRRARARRMRALRDLRQLVRVAEQDDVPRRRPDREHVGERDLPALVDEQRVDVPVQVLAREEERRAGEELELLVEHRRRSSRCSRRTASSYRVPVAARLLPPAELEPRLERRLLDVLEELVDRLVAQRRDADALPGLHQRDRHPRAVPRLPRAGRPLHEEVAAVEAQRRVLERAVRASARGGRRSRISTSAGYVVPRLREPQDGVALHAGRRAAAAGSAPAAAARPPLPAPRRRTSVPCSSSTATA